MQTPERSDRRRGFVLMELGAVLLILFVAALVCALLLPDARRRARLAGSITNLQQLGKAAGAYASDNADRVFTFSWAPGPHTCNGYTFPVATTFNDAAADQAVCILRRRTGRTDFLVTRGWIPHVFYNTLVLLDYLGEDLPSPMVASPGDGVRLSWQRSVTGPGGTSAPGIRLPYSSSYEMQPSFYSPDAQVSTPQGPIPTVAQDPMGHRYYQVGNSRTVLGGRRMNEVRFPSHKAMLYESVQRFFSSRQAYFLYPEARVPVLLADGSASIRSINQANQGFQPNLPLAEPPTRINYMPELTWEPACLNGAAAEFVNGGIRWTRSGLRGRDFAGPEVPWVP